MRKIYNTGLDVKRENYEKFSEMIKNQFEYGGNKYALSEDKEMTDLICEFSPGESGVDWILQTILKYLGRFKNFQLEKDLLKISTYCYLCWLKMGFHLEEEHEEDIGEIEGEWISIEPKINQSNIKE